jgi:hypothetical protein
MIGKWNYFEPRELLPHARVHVVACRLDADKSITYWAVDEEEGLKLIQITCEED